MRYGHEMHEKEGVHLASLPPEGEEGLVPEEGPSPEEQLQSYSIEDLQHADRELLDSVHQRAESLLQNAIDDLKAQGVGPDDPRMAIFIERKRRLDQYEKNIRTHRTAERQAYDEYMGPESLVERSVLTRLYGSGQSGPLINKDADIKKTKGQRASYESTRQALADVFSPVDPVTGERHQAVSDKHLDALTNYVHSSHYAESRSQRQRSATLAGNLGRQLAERTQRTINSRRKVEDAAIIERDARVAAGLETQLDDTQGAPDPSYLLEDHFAKRTFPGTSFQTGGDRGDLVDTPVGDRVKGINTLKKEIKTEKNAQRRRQLRAELKTQQEKYDKLKKEHDVSVQQGRDIIYRRLRGIPREQRLGGVLEPLTIEDVYRPKGHLSHEQLKGLKGLKAHAKFMKQQGKNYYGNARSGKLVAGWDADGNRVGMDDSVFAFAPNQAWRYLLNRHPEAVLRSKGVADRHYKDLEYWDTETRFHRAKRDRFGEVVPGDWEEVGRERPVKKFHKTVNVTLGKQVADLGEKRKPDDVEKDVFVPVSGIKNRSTRVIPGGGDEKWGQRLVQANGRWVPADQAAWDMRTGWSSKLTDRKSGSVPRSMRQDFDKVVRVHYVPEHEMHLAKKEKNRLAIKVPPLKVGNKELLGERLAYINLDESTDRQKRLGSAIFGYSRARERQKIQDQSYEAAQLRDIRRGNDISDVFDRMKRDPEFAKLQVKNYADRHGIPEEEAKPHLESHMKSLIAAGTFASLYGIRRSVKKGYAPQGFNNLVDSFRKGHPKVDSWLKQHNAKFLAVEDAYVRPVGEKAANWGEMLWHPLHDPDGTTGGIEWGRWRYRDFWINENKRLSLVLERKSHEIDRIQRTREWFERNAYSDNPITKIVVSRRDQNLKHKDYKEFLSQGGLLDKAETIAEEIRAKATPGSTLEREADKLAAHVKEIRDLGGNSRATNARVASWTGSKELGAPLGKHFATQRNPLTGEMQRVIASDSAMTTVGRWASHNKTPLVVGGAAATALAAHYAYHKYTESKKPKSERTAYYNKILPPAFTIPFPHVHTTGYVRLPNNAITREFGVNDKRIKARLGVHMADKRFAFRPVDRGYPANAPIFGGLHLRGHAEGSWSRSLLDNPEAIYNRKRTFTQKGRQVSVAGHKLPIYAEFGNQRKIKLSSTNPNRMNQQDRESVVWAFKDTPYEDQVKNFYSTGKKDEKILDLFDDPKEVSRIRRKKGTEEAKKFESTVESMRRSRAAERSEPDSFKLEGLGGQESVGSEEVMTASQRESEAWAEKVRRMNERGVEWR